MASGEMHAELSGRSESNSLSTISVFESKMRTQPSRLDVTSTAMSSENCMSLMRFLCTSATHISSLPVFVSHICAGGGERVCARRQAVARGQR